MKLVAPSCIVGLGSLGGGEEGVSASGWAGILKWLLRRIRTGPFSSSGFKGIRSTRARPFLSVGIGRPGGKGLTARLRGDGGMPGIGPSGLSSNLLTGRGIGVFWMPMGFSCNGGRGDLAVLPAEGSEV